MKNIITLFIVSVLFLSGCKQPVKQVDKPLNTEASTKEKTNNLIGKPIIRAANATMSFNDFWSYYNQYVEFYKDFKALDIDGKEITRISFLQHVSKGIYYPLALYSNNDRPIYQLVKIPKHADEKISAYMSKFSKDQLEFCKLEGNPVPAFDFNDVDGNHYTSEDIKGKVVLFKCWFIRCGACIKEMPALNEIVKKYKNRKDILFISLAMDNKKDLQQFLSKTKFDYATIPNQTKYMSNKLKVAAYPTHFIINKKGEIVNMLPDVTCVDGAIEKELAK